MAKIEFEIESPKAPNFLRVVGLKDTMVGIDTLSDEQLNAIADEWRKALLARAHEVRMQPKPG